MKTLSSCCLCVTLHFISDRHLTRNEACERVKQEGLEYRRGLGDNAIIVEEVQMEDGSIFLHVRKKVKDYPIGNYFNTI